MLKEAHLLCHVFGSPGLVDGDDDEAAAAADFDDDGQELGVGCAKVRVVRVASDLHLEEKFPGIR